MKRLIPCCAIALAAVVAALLARVPPTRMPQALRGGDFLSVLLGDAKKDISGAMVHEADSYFHGGVDMECHHLHSHGGHRGGANARAARSTSGTGSSPVHGHDAHGDHDHHGHEDHVHHEHGHGVEGAAHSHDHADATFDPWRWINERVRAPEIERHLEGTKAVELMPWFWVAVKSDPHNVEAWSTAWYVAARIMKDDALAYRIASEGWRQNGDSMEMACVLARAYRSEGTLDLEKSEAMFRKAIELGRHKEKLEGNDHFSFYEALGYLAEYAEKRKDRRALEKLLEEAAARGEDHPAVQSIKMRLGRLNN